MSQSRWSLGVVQHLWGPMVGIQTPPEKGCGQLRYARLGYCYAGHREDFHPMYGGSWNHTCAVLTIEIVHEFFPAKCF
jgi:hypothetical protein